jgi:GntR family transcriptional regulator
MVTLTREKTMPRVSHTRRVHDDIRARIESGEYPPGSKLPTQAAMMAAYGCSETPIKQAIRMLEAAGWVEGHQGLGVFVTERPPIA